MITQRPTIDQGKKVIRQGATAAFDVRAAAAPGARPPGFRLRASVRWAVGLVLLAAAAWLAREVVSGTVRTVIATLALFGLGVGLLTLLIGGLAAAAWLWRRGRRMIGTVFGIGIVAIWLPVIMLVLATGFSSYAFDEDITATFAETPPSRHRAVFVRGDHNEVAVAAETWAAGPGELRSSSLGGAIISIEDRDFDTRLTGVLDLLGKIRAFGAYARGRREGGSTIDEQLGKFVRGRRASGIGDYLIQDLLAARVVWLAGDRDQVLARYAGLWEAQPGRRGLAALAFDLFGVIDLRELSADQSALLAGMLRSPHDYDPRSRPGPAKERRNLVLDAMAETGRLTRAEADALKQKPLGLIESRDSLCLRTIARVALSMEGQSHE